MIFPDPVDIEAPELNVSVYVEGISRLADEVIDIVPPIASVVVLPPTVTPPAPLIVTLLNVCVVADPLMFCVALPLNVTVPLPGVNVPPLSVQFPPILIALDPAVRSAVFVKLPVTVTVGLFVFNAVGLPTVQLPPIVNVPPEGVFVPPPENVRFW